jgi:Thioesterase-like superfamily
MNAEALFVRDGDGFVAGELALGPWAPGALHGGPPAALIAHEMAAHAPSHLQLARLTLDLVRSVPLGRLSLAVETLRPGRRVTVLDATLRDVDGVEVVRARGLFLVPTELDATALQAPSFPGPEDSRPNDWQHPTPMFTTHGMEIRFAKGSFRSVGPSIAWLRLAVPLVAGEPILGIDRVLAAGDFGNGIAPAVPWEGHTFINPDLTVFVERDPVDEWVALEAVTRVQRGSVAGAESVIWDRRGRIGRAVQTLLVATT